jgi:hypothetical protein
VIAAWAGSAAGIIVVGACVILLRQAGRHGHRLPQQYHPWAYRLLIFGMYVGSCAIALTALGAWAIAAELRVASFAAAMVHAPPADVYTVCVITGILFVVVVALGAWLEPGPAIAWWALALPFVCALSGGHLHGALTVFPVTDWSSQVSSWLGGGPGARG